MAGWSPYAPNTPGLVPLVGPNGTFQVPAAVGPAFGVQGTPPIDEPLPVFSPEELAPPVAAPLQAAPAVPVQAQPDIPPPLPTLAEATAGVDQTIAGIQQRQDSRVPANATEAALSALGDQRDIARAGAGVEAAAGRDEAATYRAQGEADAAAERERGAERDRWKKEDTAARADLKSAQDAYVNHKVDQNRYWHDQTTGQKIAAAIGVALAGFGGALVARDTGRPVTNPALDMLMAAAERDVRLQLADRDKLQSAIGMKRDAVSDLRQRYTDDEAAHGAILAGNLRRTENQIKQIAAQTKDPASKLKLADLGAQTGLKAAEVLQRAEDREIDQRNADRSYGLQQSTHALQAKNYDRGVLESDRAFGETQRQFDINAGIQAKEAAAKAAEAAAKAKGATDEQARKEAEDVRDHGIGGFKSVKFNDKGLPEVSYAPFKQKDGTIFKASKINAPKLQMKKAAVDNLVQLIDDTVNLMERHGQEADFIKSPAWQEMQANWGAMAIDEKTISELGVIAGPDMELIAKKLGSGDPTQFRDTTPGLRKARENTLNKFDKELRSHQYDGAKYNITEQTSGGVQDAIKNTPLENTASASRGRVRPGDDPVGSTADSLRRSVAGLPQGEQLTPAALAGVAGAAALAKAGRPNAIALLQQMGNDPNPRMREAARDAAKKAGIEIAWPEEKK